MPIKRDRCVNGKVHALFQQKGYLECMNCRKQFPGNTAFFVRVAINMTGEQTYLYTPADDPVEALLRAQRMMNPPDCLSAGWVSTPNVGGSVRVGDPEGQEVFDLEVWAAFCRRAKEI